MNANVSSTYLIQDVDPTKQTGYGGFFFFREPRLLRTVQCERAKNKILFVYFMT